MPTNFNDFLKKFPEAQLPLTLSEETTHTFSLENPPLSERMIQENILPIEEEEADELTEFIACCRLPRSDEFHTIIYWRAGLMNYQYVLATFSNGGKPIDRRVLAGTFSDGKIILRSVARIDEDWTIYIVSGLLEGSELSYDATVSKAVELELLPDGKIVELV